MERLIKIEKIERNINELNGIFNKVIQSPNAEVREALRKSEEPEYLYWDKIKYKSWIPEKFTKKEFWLYIKTIRSSRQILTPITDDKGQKFTWCKLQKYEKFLHNITISMAEYLVGPLPISKKDEQEFLARGILEEAIASSQMEGAHITRVAAKKIIREGREPVDKSEKMIVNNYKTMNAIQADYKKRPLSLQMLYEMHSMITKGTLAQNKQGRLREDSDNIVVQPNNDPHKISYIAPRMEFVEAEINKLVSFANDDETDFVHPVIKAIMLHFWIGLLHPFADGNGRLARVIFYWYLLRKGYWAFAFLPISEAIKKSHGQYSDAYIYSEQDDNDLTYFIDYNIRKIILAQEELQKYVKAKLESKSQQALDFGAAYKFNDRQARLIRYLHENPNERTNPTAHKSVYSISKLTALTDLKKLEEAGFLRAEKQGVYVFYYATEKLHAIFSE